MKGSPGKNPAIYWYYKDWLSDKQLQRTSPSTRGIWMNLLMYMIDCSLDGEDCEAGKLELSERELCQLGSCTPAEAELFIEEALRLKFCDMSRVDHDYVTVMSRRIHREEERRAKWRERKAKQRSSEAYKPNSTESPGKSPGDVQPSRARPTPNPSPTSKLKKKLVIKKKPPAKPKPKPKTKPQHKAGKAYSTKPEPVSKKPPAEDEVKAFFHKKRWPADEALRFFEYYDTTGWLRKDGTPVYSWKGQAVTWMSYKQPRANGNGDLESMSFKFPTCRACGAMADNIVSGEPCPFCGGKA